MLDTKLVKRYTQSYYKLNQDQRAVSILNELIKKYPQSNYVKDTHYLLGFCF
ncbi:tetratricopeptide repeat protein, partial [Candidatus Woesearchaeota archaeon]|nr:tetratricopeptide repeat protein [Candidatus Woesearchaeota archaeon]